MSEVGSRKVYEDDRIVVWYFDLAPGEHGPVHTHHRNYVVRVVSGASLEVCDGDGNVLYAAEREPSDPMTFRVDGDRVQADYDGAPVIPATHSVRNVGDTTFSEVLIEFKE